MADKSRPIIVIKKKGGHGGHHGGAWKVAYADFVTAMMSLFIVLWLMGSSSKVKQAVAGYFNDPKGVAALLGTAMSGTGVGPGQTVEQLNTNDLQKLKDKLDAEIKARKDLEKLSKQIEITITPEGLRIELIEGKDGTFYELGSPKLSANGQELLALLATELKTLPNSLLIEGHTDSTPYSDGNGYSDQMLRVKNNPTDPSNRRISILVKNDNEAVPTLSAAKIVDGSTPLPGAQKPTSALAEKGKPQAAQPMNVAGSKPAVQAPAEVQAQAPPKPAAQTATKSSAATPAAKPSLLDRLKSLWPRKKK